MSTSDTLRLVARWRERCSDGPELPLIKGSVTPSTCSYADFDVSLVCDRPGCSFEVEATGPAEHGYAIDLHTPAEAGPLGIEVTLTHAETGETHTEHLDLELGAPAHYELVCLGHVDHVDPADPTARECATAWPGELRHAGENRITPSFAVVLEARDEAGRALLFSPESSLEGGGSALDRGLVDPCLELFGGRCVGLAGPGTVRFTHHDRVITLVLSADGSVLEREE